jgi:hypothetical protein
MYACIYVYLYLYLSTHIYIYMYIYLTIDVLHIYYAYHPSVPLLQELPEARRLREASRQLLGFDPLEGPGVLGFYELLRGPEGWALGMLGMGDGLGGWGLGGLGMIC